MSRENMVSRQTPDALRRLVKISVRLLGKVIKDSAGIKIYTHVESIRQKMVNLRELDEVSTRKVLRSTFAQLSRLSPSEKLQVARSYTLMLELMNSCENAYRSYRLAEHAFEAREARRVHGEKVENASKMGAEWVSHNALKPSAVIYVLTAHPTEARAPENISIFHVIQAELINILEKNKALHEIEAHLLHSLELAWRTMIVRDQSPQVEDEARHIYSTLLEPSTLDSLLLASHEIVPVYVRSWVGGDKDGHPGVNEKVMHRSLTLSRSYLIKYICSHLSQVSEQLKNLNIQSTQKQLSLMYRQTQALKILKAGDGLRLTKFKVALNRLFAIYKKEFGSLHPGLGQLRRLMHVFPGIVVPLELRESSDILMSDTSAKGGLAIDRMLKTLAKLSRGGDPRWYARGLIVSMTQNVEHLRTAKRKVSRAFGKSPFSVIPLFEQAKDLRAAPAIISEWLDSPHYQSSNSREWGPYVEMMVGYSDSSKESGVLASRLEIAQAMFKLEKLCLDRKVLPLFFQGSGGSVDRGGGSIQDQIAWWPHSALKIYKVTVQGEMIERSLASPEITRGVIDRIAKSAAEILVQKAKPPQNLAVKNFADKVGNHYKEMTHNPAFLEMVEKATPYSRLGKLHIGSRPSKRSKTLSVSGLRAIPWVLCWTQTRILFPTWWGVGTGWKNSTRQEQESLKNAFHSEPVFSSFVRALGFTLAKVDLGVWRMYLENSSLDRSDVDHFYQIFKAELALTFEMLNFISGDSDPMWFNPRLSASIKLRSSMIHPLNLLQIIAMNSGDSTLLRLTVTGVSSGMLTTG